MSEVVKDIPQHHVKSGGNVLDLPSVPLSIGGDVDFLVRIKYLRYHPEPIVKLPSGLTIYKFDFKSSDGTRGVIGGPHQDFSNIKEHGLCKTFFTNQLKTFQSEFQVNPEKTEYTNRVAFHTDVSKMYNANKLNESDWCYQRYLWDESLTPGKEP